MRIYLYFILLATANLLYSCQGKNKTSSYTHNSIKMNQKPITFITLAPGHFHAALVQKTMYDEVKPTAFVYTTKGPELDAFLKLVDGFNTRKSDPTSWKEIVYTGPDYLEKMCKEKPGNVVVIAGNNAKKTEYILSAVENGLHVFSDKPMVITPESYPLLIKAFQTAQKRDILLYDIMTERYEITTLLQQALSGMPGIFGILRKGTAEEPALVQESVHRFFKKVAGLPLIRPAWFFDVNQEGEGMVDVGTHLVDLIFWEAFPKTTIQKSDIEITSAKHWTTDLSPKQFKKITNLNSYPAYLAKYLAGDTLKVYSNGEIHFKLKGIAAKISVTWNFGESLPSDTHYSLMRGTLCDLIIKQESEQDYKSTLFIKTPGSQNPDAFEKKLTDAFRQSINKKFPGTRPIRLSNNLWAVEIPDKYNVGHEAHFRQVTEKFLNYLQHNNMPVWEVPNMISKYYITTQALAIARNKER